MSITKPTSSTLRLLLTIKPNARTTAVVAVDPACRIALRIHAPPRDGEANEEVVRFLAKALGLKKSDAKVVWGMKGREKTVEMAGAAGVEVGDVIRALEGLVGE